MNREEMLSKLKEGLSPLEVSILKWKDIIKRKGKDNAQENCALCNAHYMCYGCPVKAKTGKNGCRPFTI